MKNKKVIILIFIAIIIIALAVYFGIKLMWVNGINVLAKKYEQRIPAEVINKEDYNLSEEVIPIENITVPKKQEYDNLVKSIRDDGVKYENGYVEIFLNKPSDIGAEFIESLDSDNKFEKFVSEQDYENLRQKYSNRFEYRKMQFLNTKFTYNIFTSFKELKEIYVLLYNRQFFTEFKTYIFENKSLVIENLKDNEINGYAIWLQDNDYNFISLRSKDTNQYKLNIEDILTMIK